MECVSKFSKLLYYYLHLCKIRAYTCYLYQSLPCVKTNEQICEQKKNTNQTTKTQKSNVISSTLVVDLLLTVSNQCQTGQNNNKIVNFWFHRNTSIKYMHKILHNALVHLPICPTTMNLKINKQFILLGPYVMQT